KPVTIREKLCEAKAYCGKDGKLYSMATGREIQFWHVVLLGVDRGDSEARAELGEKYTVIDIDLYPPDEELHMRRSATNANADLEPAEAIPESLRWRKKEIENALILR